MYWSKLKWTAAVVLALGLFGSGAGVATYEALAGGQAPPKDAAKAEPPAAKPTVATFSLPPGTSIPLATPDKTKPADEHSKAAGDRRAALCNKLEESVTIDKPIDNQPLKDVLEYLTDRYGVTFIVDNQAFDRDKGLKNVEDSPVRLPKMSAVRLQTVLRYVLDQVSGVVLVRGDHLEITTNDRQMMDAFGDSPLLITAFPPTVNVAFRDRPLEQALADLAGQAGVSVVLDPRVPERDKLLVTAQLLNTPIDTAVRVAAELAGQKAVALGSNVFYVTTPDHAKMMREESKAFPSRWNTDIPPASKPAGK